ncbi:MAG: peptidoglycan-associated lipoprotein Pal [Deltaproteobacteria bacterium]|nr:peptidoglycan-associated lipoprotein Pal [Deltaproteobacteria bacterium]
MKYLSFLFALAAVAVLYAGCQNKKGVETAVGLKRVHFDFDSSAIRDDMAKVLDANAGYLKRHKDLKITIEGNCDERGTNEYNLALGDRRAGAVERYLTGQGVGGNRLKTVSYGEEKPICSKHSETCWWENRRADFITD